MIKARIYTRFSQVAEGIGVVSLLFEKGIEKIVKWYLFSKITPSLFVDKASCTRQFESKLSLHSLASLFPLKEGSTSHLGLLPSGKKRKTALLGARNRYALRMAGHQSPRQMVRDGTAGGRKFTVNSL